MTEGFNFGNMNENERLCYIRGYELGIQVCTNGLVNMDESVKNKFKIKLDVNRK